VADNPVRDGVHLRFVAWLGHSVPAVASLRPAVPVGTGLDLAPLALLTGG